jgi:hypothetical protein
MQRMYELGCGERPLARVFDAKAALAAAIGVPIAALDGAALSWPRWTRLQLLNRFQRIRSGGTP